MAGVDATISVNIQARETGAAGLGGTPQYTALVAKAVALAAGTANDNQANVLFSGHRTLATATSENLDMAGTLIGALGETVTMAEASVIYIEADATNTTDITFGGAASNPFNGPLGGTLPTVVLHPGDCALFCSKDGWTVTPATGDLLKVANGAGATGGYTVVIIGRTSAT
jgi:hypothetical protein